MKKIIVELEDDVYSKLLEMTQEIKNKFRTSEITPEAIAADIIADAIKLDQKLKGARDNMNDMFSGLGDLGGLGDMNPEDMLNNLKDLFGSMSSKSDSSKKEEKQTSKKVTKKSKIEDEEEDEEEFAFKS